MGVSATTGLIIEEAEQAIRAVSTRFEDLREWLAAQGRGVGVTLPKSAAAPAADAAGGAGGAHRARGPAPGPRPSPEPRARAEAPCSRTEAPGRTRPQPAPGRARPEPARPAARAGGALVTRGAARGFRYRRVALTLGLFLLAPPLLLLILLAGYPVAAPSSAYAPYAAIEARSRAVVLLGADGSLTGTLPLAGRPGHEGATHEYLPAGPVNPDYLKVLVRIEDRWLGTPFRSVSCLDVPSLVKAGFAHLLRLRSRGGSSLCQQVSRAMRALSPTSDRGQDKLDQRRGRKWTEIFDGMVIYRDTGGIDDPRFQALLANHFEMIRGASGSRMGPTIRGIEASAQILWGKSQAELSLAQAAILAAAVRWPIALAPDGDPAGQAEIAQDWVKTRDRAMLGIREAYDAGDPRAVAALAELARISPLRPYLPAQLDLPGMAPLERFQLATNLNRRVQRVAGAEVQTALADIADRIGKDRLRDVDGLRLTLDLDANAAWKRAVSARLAAARSDPHLLAEIAATPGKEQQPFVALLKVDDQGQIEHFYANRDQLAFVNGEPGERGADGRYDPARSVRPIGSLGKGLAALLLASRTAPDARWCNRRIDGKVTNADGDPGVTNCAAQGGQIPVTQVFARSLNLPVIEALRQVSDAEIRVLAVRAHVHLPDGVDPRIALALGMATARLTDIVALYGALSHGVAEHPTILASYRLRGDPRWIDGRGDAASRLDLRDYLDKPGARAFVTTMLSAPLDAGGTLAAFQGALPASGNYIAKSGTVVFNELTVQKYAVFASRSGQGALLLYFGSPTVRVPLGRQISWRPFAPLAGLLTQPVGAVAASPVAAK
ncbi:MAG: transglycosylase domain-containing protein [Sphingomonas sp.]|uniref:transglycosylase domain-containing protein n=1 Tax=Sphingomonas sp. TaxID=28214 RepID=UPI0025ED5400|nr:transglycosylase domain-containing protein [Sphingomonas sp.]MBX3566314.1 transglycosylase domain-containing protein [Sphingomonas sp.]